MGFHLTSLLKNYNMYKDSIFFCLTPELQVQFAEDIGGKLHKNKIIEIPADLGKGYVFFIQAIPGMAVLLWDCYLKKSLKIKAYKDEIKRYIFHFDLSEQTNFLTVCDKKREIGNSINYGLSIFNNQNDSYFEPSIDERTFSVRLYIEDKLMHFFVENNENIHKKLKLANKNIFSDDLDGNSLLLLLSLSEKSIDNESFDAFIKAISLQLLSNFIKKSSETQTSVDINEFEDEGLKESKNYLLNHLHSHFPSIAFLSKLANMSSTKFKILFKKKFKKTAYDLFISEKMDLANKMLESGDYNSMTEIIHELNYNKLQPFTLRYFQIFKKKPSEDFIKKEKS